MIVPTKYYTVPTDLFREWGISLVIWANHNLRASISAMQDVTQQIYKDQSLVNVEKRVRTSFLLSSSLFPNMASFLGKKIQISPLPLIAPCPAPNTE